MMYFLLLLALGGLIAIASTVVQIARDCYHRTPDRMWESHLEPAAPQPTRVRDYARSV